MEQNFENPILENKDDSNVSSLEPKQSKKKMIWIVLGIIIAIIVLGFVVWKFGLSGNLGGKAAQMFPLPVSRVNGSFVTSTKLDKNYQALKFFYNSQEGQSEKKMSDLDIKKMALDRLIEDKIISQLAKKYNVSVSKDEMEKEYKLVLKDYDSEDELVKEIKNLYDMTISEFKEEVLMPSLYYDKLQKAYLMDDRKDPERKKKNDEAKKKAEEALAKLKSGKDFAELAREVSEDKTTKKEGGDLGFFGKDEMELEFEEAAWKLKEGEMSDLVRTIEGWHIIKVEKKKGSGDDEQVKARHILFRVKDDFDKWFLDQKKRAKVKIYLKDIKWNKDQAAIEGLSESEEELTPEDIEIENVEVEPVK